MQGHSELAQGVLNLADRHVTNRYAFLYRHRRQLASIDS